jgi:hypothetical protein
MRCSFRTRTRAPRRRRRNVFVDAAKGLVEVRHDLLRPHHENDFAGAGRVGPELTATRRCRDQRSGLGDRVHAADHHVRRRGQPADIVSLLLPVHAPDLRVDGVVPTGVVDLFGNACLLERLRRTVMDLRSGRDEIQDNLLRLTGICGAEDADPVGLESRGRSCDAGIVRRDRELTAERPLEIRLVLGVQGFLSVDEPIYLRPQIQYWLGGCACK